MRIKRQGSRCARVKANDLTEFDGKGIWLTKEKRCTKIGEDVSCHYVRIIKENGNQIQDRVSAWLWEDDSRVSIKRCIWQGDCD